MIHTDGKPTVASAHGGAKKPPTPHGRRPFESTRDQIARGFGRLLADEAKREAGER